jgi:hypothetical protein
MTELIAVADYGFAGCQGLTRRTPQPSKSAVLRVARMASRDFHVLAKIAQAEVRQSKVRTPDFSDGNPLIEMAS